jgi:hypothetical protein
MQGRLLYGLIVIVSWIVSQTWTMQAPAEPSLPFKQHLLGSLVRLLPGAWTLEDACMAYYFWALWNLQHGGI